MATNQINVILVVVLLSYEKFELIYLSFTSLFGNKGNIVIVFNGSVKFGGDRSLFGGD